MEHGKILYRYTVSNGKFFIHEGVVNDCGTRLLVNFKDGGAALRCPRKEDLGKIRSVGHSLWMDHRDDSFARREFIYYESKKIVGLQKQIDRKVKTIEMLMELEIV